MGGASGLYVHADTPASMVAKKDMSQLDFHHVLTVSRTNAMTLEYSATLRDQLHRASRSGIRLIMQQVYHSTW